MSRNYRLERAQSQYDYLMLLKNVMKATVPGQRS